MYYSDKWLNEDPSRIAPHKDIEVSREREKYFKRFFSDIEDRTIVNTKFANFSLQMGEFADLDSLHDK